MNLKIIKAGIALAGGVLTGILGGWDIALQVLICFVIADYATGVAAAWINKELNSLVGFRGIAKKILLFVPVGIAYALDQLTGYEVLRSVAIIFYVANEGLSIVENLGNCGVPIPAVLARALEQMKDKAEEGDTNDDH